MKREERKVCYSFEHGDPSLPTLKELATDTPDPMKEQILAYLKTHLVAACPGIVMDEINPDKVIGDGSIFSDGTYRWEDVFCNYVDRYNIPVPVKFREHIIKNYSARMDRHALFRSIDCVEIENNPYLGYRYICRIEKNGAVHYQNNTDCKEKTLFYIEPDDAKYIIDPIMSELFCYDADEHGKALIDGYHWKISFFKEGELVDTTEGWPNEDAWRYQELKTIASFVERFIPKSLGSDQMNVIIRRSVCLTGWVQGVGLRWRAKSAADALGVTGWVRNDPDGSVTMELQGTERQIDGVILAVERGGYVRIENMRVKTLPAQTYEYGFHVRGE